MESIDTIEKNFNPYQVLNISERATDAEIKIAFRSLAKAFHPDKQIIDHPESTKYFEKVDEAYQILSVPFRRFIFDNYGSMGIALYNKTPAKFQVLEEALNLSLSEVGKLADQDVGSPAHIRALDNLHTTKKRIEKSFKYISVIGYEQEINRSFQKEVNMEMEISAEEMIKYYLFKTHGHQRQMQASKIDAVLKPINYGMSNWISIPHSSGFDNLIGVYAESNMRDSKTTYGVCHKFRKIFQNYGGLLLSTYTTIGVEKKIMIISAGRMVKDKFYLECEAHLSTTLRPALVSKVTRKLNENTSFNATFIKTGKEEAMHLSIGKSLENTDMRGVISFQGILTTFKYIITHKMTRRLSYFSEMDFAVYPFVGFEMTEGVKFRMSNSTTLTLSTTFAINKIYFNFAFDRFGITIKLPILFSNRLEKKSFLLAASLVLFGTLGFWNYEKNRSVDPNKLLHLEKKNTVRLHTAHKQLEEKNQELSYTLPEKILWEKNVNGLIILKALYGLPAYIDKLYRLEVRKTGATKTKTEKDPLMLLQIADEEISLINFEDIKNEISDIRKLLQIKVRSGTLEVEMDKMYSDNEFYNPCIDYRTKPSLLLKIWLDQEVHVVVLKKGQKKCFGRRNEPMQRSFREIFKLDWFLP